MLSTALDKDEIGSNGGVRPVVIPFGNECDGDDKNEFTVGTRHWNLFPGNGQ